eukprot:914884-Prymnesium_polylepis.1
MDASLRLRRHTHIASAAIAGCATRWSDAEVDVERAASALAAVRDERGARVGPQLHDLAPLGALPRGLDCERSALRICHHDAAPR